MNTIKWPKQYSLITPEQQAICDDHMKHWLEIMAKTPHFNFIDKYFNHGYVIRNTPNNFLTTLDIGAGIGSHYAQEKLSFDQRKNYVALELRDALAQQIQQEHPEIQVINGDCQQKLPFNDGYFDRILAIHILEHLPNLPAALKEIYRLCNKEKGVFSIVIPCEGGLLYSIIRKITAQRIFEKRYQQPYKWYIEREHLNYPHEIFEELKPFFRIKHKTFFPAILPSIDCNLFIGMTLEPLKN